VPHARDALKYLPLPAYQHELQNSDPVWVFELRGELPMLNGPSFASGQSGPQQVAWIDPICIVSKQFSGFIGAGPVRMSDGTTVAPPPAPSPSMLLPTRAP
jgi:hypothetical protein